MSEKVSSSGQAVSSKPVSAGLIAWPALALMMVASVGSIAQLSDSATFGLGAITVYLIPAILFLLPVGLVGVIVLALPAQLLYHFRRPQWASVDESVIAESEE